jgi:hypothetical protein
MEPYIEHKISSTEVIRTFRESIDSADLLWHRDLEDRVIESLNNNDWLIQLDDQIPKNLKQGDTIMISKGTWHRIIKGSNVAIFKINKNKTNDES